MAAVAELGLFGRSTMRNMMMKVATALLRQRDERRRRRMILTYSIVLLLIFLAHSYFSNLSSPLRLIPQTFAAVAMGYIILCIISLRQFKYVAEFIDWAKVSRIAEPSAPPNGGPTTQPGHSGSTGGPPSVS